MGKNGKNGKGNDPKVKSRKRGKNVTKAPKQHKSKGKNPTYSDNGLPRMSSTSSNRNKSTSTPTRYSPKEDWWFDDSGRGNPNKPAAKRTEKRPTIGGGSTKKK